MMSSTSLDMTTVSAATYQRCPYKNLFWKYAANLRENIHASVCNSQPATLLKKDSDTDTFLWILRNFYKNTFFREFFWVTTSVILLCIVISLLLILNLGLHLFTIFSFFFYFNLTPSEGLTAVVNKCSFFFSKGI